MTVLLVKWYDSKVLKRGDVIIPVALRKESGIGAGELVKVTFSGTLGSDYDSRMCRVTEKHSVTILLQTRERNRIRSGDPVKIAVIDDFTVALRNDDKKCFKCGSPNRVNDDLNLPYCQTCLESERNG